MGKQFEIDDDYCKEAADAYFAEEEEMKLGIHPTQIHEKIRKYFDENDLLAYPFTYELKGDHLAYVEIFTRIDDETYDWEYYGLFDHNKCEFVQDDLSIKETMEVFYIEDNPFDVIAHATMEIMRTAMFSSHRYRNEEVTELLWNGYISYSAWVDIIKHQYDLLDKVNDKTIKFLRETSYFGRDYGQAFIYVNDFILNLEKRLDIEYSHSNPFRDLEYEKERLGEDSKEYQRMMFLINLTDRNSLTEDELSRLYDMMEHGSETIKYGWVTEDEYNKKKVFIDKNHLTQDEINLMISYLEKKNKRYSANS